MMLSALLVVSCSEDSGDKESDNNEVEFSLSVTDENGSGNLSEGSSVGLFVYDQSTSSYVVSNGATIVGSGGSLMGAPTLSAGHQYTIYAYSPYRAEWNDIVDTSHRFDVETDQSQKASYESSDLIITKTTINDNQAKVDFQHLLTKIVVHVTDQTGTIDVSSSGQTYLVLNDMATSVMFNLEEGVKSVIQDETSDVRMFTLDQSKRRISAAAIVAPQEKGEGDSLFKLYVAGKYFRQYPLAATEQLLSGKTYIYRMTLTEGGLIIDNTQITDWVNSGQEINLITEE